MSEMSVGMQFYALGYKYENDVFYDFEKEGDVDGFDLKASCLLPTRKLAEQLIEKEVGDSYFVVEVELNSLNERTGNFSFTVDYSKTEEHWEM